MGLLSFLKKSSGRKSYSNLKTWTQDATSSSEDPEQGTYSIADNGPEFFDSAEPSHFRPSGTQLTGIALPELPAQSPFSHRFMLKRPSTAPNGAEPQFSPDTPRSKAARDSVRGSLVGPPVSLMARRLASRSVSQFHTRSEVDPQSARGSLSIEPPRPPFAASHARHVSQSSPLSRPGGRFVDLLDAQSDINPPAFRRRIEAAGARDYGEDVADRNIGPNGVDLHSDKVQAFYKAGDLSLASTPAPKSAHKFTAKPSASPAVRPATAHPALALSKAVPPPTPPMTVMDQKEMDISPRHDAAPQSPNCSDSSATSGRTRSSSSASYTTFPRKSGSFQPREAGAAPPRKLDPTAQSSDMQNRRASANMSLKSSSILVTAPTTPSTSRLTSPQRSALSVAGSPGIGPPSSSWRPKSTQLLSGLISRQPGQASSDERPAAHHTRRESESSHADRQFARERPKTSHVRPVSGNLTDQPISRGRPLTSQGRQEWSVSAASQPYAKEPSKTGHVRPDFDATPIGRLSSSRPTSSSGRGRRHSVNELGILLPSLPVAAPSPAPRSPRLSRNSVMLPRNKMADTTLLSPAPIVPTHRDSPSRQRARSAGRPSSRNQSLVNAAVLAFPDGSDLAYHPHSAAETGRPPQRPTSRGDWPRSQKASAGQEGRGTSKRADVDLAAAGPTSPDAAPSPHVMGRGHSRSGSRGLPTQHGRTMSMVSIPKKMDITDYVPERTSSMRHWSMTSTAPTTSSLSSSPFARPHSSHTANTSVDLAKFSAIITSSRSSFDSHHVSNRLRDDLGLDHRLKLPGAAEDHLPLPADLIAALGLSRQRDFNMDDYISSDDDSFVGRLDRPPSAGQEEELLFRDSGYGPGGIQLPGLFDAIPEVPSDLEMPARPPSAARSSRRTSSRPSRPRSMPARKRLSLDASGPLPQRRPRPTSSSSRRSFAPGYDLSGSGSSGDDDSSAAEARWPALAAGRRGARRITALGGAIEEENLEKVDVRTAIRLRKEAKARKRARSMSKKGRGRGRGRAALLSDADVDLDDDNMADVEL